MCGIAGILGPREGLDTVAMLSALAHRGPDDSGTYAENDASNGGIWLGHRRLAIQDPSPAGHQPMLSDDGRLVIVFNGEIYNFKELRTHLEARGHVFKTGTDTEVILAAYRALGPAAIERLRGMFAIALWDRPQRTLLLARDRLGEKPLYYAQTPNHFLFASEVRALLASGGVERELDTDGLDAYLTFGSLADPFTLVRGIRSVEAGQMLLVKNGGVEHKTYWDLAEIGTRHGISSQQAVEVVRERLQQSVRRCMVSDVPVAILLSGGIDSSTNVVMLAEQHWNALRTFSVVFPIQDDVHSEERYSSLIASKFGTSHERAEITLETAKELVPRAVAAMDQPSHDGVNTYLVANAIHQRGIKVAVSGQGADELFLGYPMPRHWFGPLATASTLFPSAFKGQVKALASRFPLRPDTRDEKIAEAISSSRPVASAYLALHSVFSHSSIERLRGSRRPDSVRFVRDAGGVSSLDRLSRLEIRHYLKNTLLRDGDQMSMANGLEMRGSFLDSDLVEAVVSLPSRYKIDRHRNKPLLLDTVGPALPREIWDRPKHGFGLPYDRWLKDGLHVAGAEGDGTGLDARAVADVRQRFVNGALWTRHWTLEVLTAWVQQHRMGTRYL
jgi:asparagine synthase (glutamine-hydrolysing)